MTFTTDDIGCWADGAAGHQNIRCMLARIVEEAGMPERADIVASLRGDMPDDAWDEHEALDWLNTNMCDGVYFEMYDGDLIVTDGADEQ